MNENQPCDITEWSEFFRDYDKFDQQRLHQKAQGVNDYNIISSLLKPHDEVRLHSRFIYSLINPNSLHYQNTVFLEKFLSVLGVEKEFDLESTEVFLEYENIDLYCTDGEKHLIIENKIYAKDQKEQIKRYIETINSDNHIHHDDIIVVYLSISRESPTERSLGTNENGYKIDSSKDVCYLIGKSDGLKKARYINMNYRPSKNKESEILEWINLCRQQSIKLNSVSSALDCYESIVSKLNKTYKSNIMTLESFLLEDENLSKSRIIQSSEIYKSLPAIYARWLNDAMTAGVEELMLPYENDETAVRMTAANCHALKKYEYRNSDSDSFFSLKAKVRAKNKGVFWAIAKGKYSDRVALTMYFGVSHLHIGVIPITKHDNGLYEIQPNQKETILGAIRDHRNTYSVSKVKKLGLLSWSRPLSDEVVNLHDFFESQQRERLEELIEIFTKE